MRRNNRYEALKILADVSRAASSSLDMESVGEVILQKSIDALHAENASLFLINEESGHLMLTKAKGFNEDEIDNIRLLGSWEAINDQLVKKRKPLIVNNVKTDPIFTKKVLPFSHEKLPVRSFLAVPLEKDRRIVGALIVSNRKRTQHLFTKKDEELMLTLSNHVAIALMNVKLYQDLKSLFISTVKSLVRAVDAKDRYTSGHSERVMRYSLLIGRELGLDEDALENLRLSALLHDVGKIGIRESILYKPAKLSGYEKGQIRHHPRIGVMIVKEIENSQYIIRGILEHHERWDGKGYPNRLKGRKISVEGRVIALADAYDALTTNRPYQKSYSPKESFLAIIKGSSTHFDPQVIRAFTASFSKHPDEWRP